MKAGRLVFLAVLGLLVGAAGGFSTRTTIQAPVTNDFPVPPIPPAYPPPSQTAPLPDLDLNAPEAGSSAGTHLSPSFFHQPDYNSGQGYVRGSTIEGQQDQRSRPIPGVNLKVPFQ